MDRISFLAINYVEIRYVFSPTFWVNSLLTCVKTLRLLLHAHFHTQNTNIYIQGPGVDFLFLVCSLQGIVWLTSEMMKINCITF